MNIITKKSKRITPVIIASLLKNTTTGTLFYRHRWVRASSGARRQHYSDFEVEQFKDFDTFIEYVEELPMKKGQIKI